MQIFPSLDKKLALGVWLIDASLHTPVQLPVLHFANWMEGFINELDRFLMAKERAWLVSKLCSVKYQIVAWITTDRRRGAHP